MAISALLAQLVEQLTLNQRVVGSSPTGGTFLTGGEQIDQIQRPPFHGAMEFLLTYLYFQMATFICHYTNIKI